MDFTETEISVTVGKQSVKIAKMNITIKYGIRQTEKSKKKMLDVGRKREDINTTLKLLKNIFQKDVLIAVRKMSAFWSLIMLGELRKEQKAEALMGLLA